MSLDSQNNTPMPDLARIAATRTSYHDRVNQLREKPSLPHQRMSIADIRGITAYYPQPDVITLPSDELLDPEEVCADGSVYFPSPNVALFYTKGVATPLPTDDMRSSLINSLRSNDAVFVLGIRKNINIPQMWLTALETFKANAASEIDFDFVIVPTETDVTAGNLYVGTRRHAIPLEHDDHMCTTDEALIATLTSLIIRTIPPIYKRSRAIRKAVEKAVTSDRPSTHAPEPIIEIRRINAVEDTLLRWDAQYRNNQEAARRDRFRNYR